VRRVWSTGIDILRGKAALNEAETEYVVVVVVCVFFVFCVLKMLCFRFLEKTVGDAARVARQKQADIGTLFACVCIFSN
jgi:hypothetical protein